MPKVIDEVKNEATPEEAAAEVLTTPAEVIPKSGDITTEVETFDPAAFAEEFGVPLSAVQTAKDADAALDAIREFTDKTLIAGFEAADVPSLSETPVKPPAGAAPTSKGAVGSNPEVDALRAELVEVKTILQQQAQNNQQQQLNELDARIQAEVDSWASPRYGVGKTRSYKQVRAGKELRDLVRTHVAGLQVTGGEIPVIEVALRRARAFDDPDYKPGKKSAVATLGTPGAAKGAKPSGKDLPRNIHEAYASNPF